METYWNPATRENGLSDKNGRGVYAREHKPLLDKEIAKVRQKYGNKLAKVTFDETAPRQLRNRIVTAPVQVIEHDTGAWWGRTITDLRRKAPGFSHGDIRRFVFWCLGVYRLSEFN